MGYYGIMGGTGGYWITTFSWDVRGGFPKPKGQRGGRIADEVAATTLSEGMSGRKKTQQ